MNFYKFYKNPEDLNGYEDRIYYVPQSAYEALKDNPNSEDKDRLENAIAKSAKYSCEYAISVLKGPFPKGENAIAKDSFYSVRYTKKILQAPFPKGEDAIAKDAQYSFEYAKYVLKKAFPKGEEAIAKDDWYWDIYQQFLKGLK